MTDDRLDRELGELLRAAADVEVPAGLAGRIAAIPDSGRAPLRPNLRGALRLGTLLVGGLIVLALAWGLPRIAPAPGNSASPSAATSRRTDVSTPTPRPCSEPIPTNVPAGTGPTPTPYPATPTPRTPAGPTPTAAPGSFSRTGSLAGARYGATATRLNDGRVLIVGGTGNSGSGLMTTAELYDPATCRFQAGGFLPSARPGFTATLLLDGRVLIVGGYDTTGGHTIASALLYDPATGTFTETGSLKTGRSAHYAARLADGRVLIAGGESTSDGGLLTSAELFDPGTGSFSQTGSMGGVRMGAGVALLPDGKVLFAGGTDGVGYTGTGHTGDLSSAELYDPATGTFRPTGSMLEGTGQTATVLDDGLVLVLAQVRNVPVGTMPIFRPSAELYDPKTGKFSLTGSPTAPAGLGWPSWAGAALLPDGRVFVLGGTTAQFYDPVAGTFASTASATLRSGPAMAVLQDGTVLIAGGSVPVGDTPGPSLSTAEIFWP
jgi:hypothetical protein